MKAKRKIRRVEASLPISIIKENDKFVAYTPALDISTYGHTYEEARKRFGELVEIFFDELCEMGTVEEVLEDCGWTKVTTPQTAWIPPTVVRHSTEKIKIPCPV